MWSSVAYGHVCMKSSSAHGHYPLIRIYHTTNGQLLGKEHGKVARIRVCAVSHGGPWICSVLDEYA
ncbi:hypothetical protein BDV36DRAFT_252723 [Aspergillus pseudocaelatus]|uniref:Uncharacterized protein n=1 Tax=Aspergillus pseudocaelatus TaxID=1825620 RepID=A0ABQ6WQT9_9EURO|nr:hypothetical protein BDV36DRAFT_252723 [Aspergillus pseudocaelatus]